MLKNNQMKIGSRRKRVSHIYTFAIIWVFMTFFTNVSADVTGLIILSATSLAASVFVYWLMRDKKDHELDTLLKSEFVKSGDKDAKEVLEALQQIEVLKASLQEIKGKKVTKKGNEIVQVSKEILDRVTKKPELIPSIRRFFGHHLPTAVKLVTDYQEMEQQNTKGENIHSSMKKIEEALGMLEDGLKKQLDSLFSNTVLDLETDVDVLENILKKDGLIDSGSINSFKNKENE